MRQISRSRPALAWAGTLLAALLLASCATPPAKGPAPAASRSPTALRVATWNMEHLAEIDNAGCRPRTDADYLQMRDYVDRKSVV